jgi:hypothetical protein
MMNPIYHFNRVRADQELPPGAEDAPSLSAQPEAGQNRTDQDPREPAGHAESDKPGPFDAVTHTETTAGGGVWGDVPVCDVSLSTAWADR